LILLHFFLLRTINLSYFIFKMDSEVDFSFSEPSTTQDSTQIGSRSQPARTTWAHARLARDGEDSSLRYCIHCTEEPIYKTSVTTNMRWHLQTKHQIIVNRTPGLIQATTTQQLQQLYLRAESSGETEAINTQVFRKHLNQDIINEALVSLIVVRNLPFRTVEWPEFHTLCQVLNPQSSEFLTTAHSQVRKKIDQSWNVHKDVVRRKLQSAISSIHLSLDIWTSPNGLLLLGICAHFVNHLQEHIKALIALPEVANHSGEEQFAVVLPVLKDYGIVRKLGAIVSDNASTNDTLCRTIEAHLLEEEDVEWDSTHWRIRCTGHIINLAVQAFLFQSIIEIEQLDSYDEKERRGEIGDEEESRVVFRLLGPLGQLHNIIVHIRGSSGRIKEFVELAGRMIPLDNRTRWNSWFLMLVVAIEKAGAIDTYAKNHFATLQEDYLTPQDWKRLRTIKDFLQPFHRATLETQGDAATINKVLFTMDILVQYFEATLVSNLCLKLNNTNIVRQSQYTSDKDFTSRIKKGWEIFDKYYSKTDNSPLYAAALILHPNRRTKYIKANWKAKWVKPTLKKVKELWETYREQASTSLISPSYDKAPVEQEKELDVFDQIAQRLGGYNRPASQDEYQDYCSRDPYDIGEMSALQWWCQDQQRKRWPRLSYMAIDILSIPAMSDEPERVFSGARRTMSWDRAQMGAETLEKVECLKHWKGSGILSDMFVVRE
jgi:hypothetical protein